MTAHEGRQKEDRQLPTTDFGKSLDGGTTPPSFSLPEPAGKGRIPRTEKEADASAYYDTILALWAKIKPLMKPVKPSYAELTPAIIEKMCQMMTGVPRGIPLEVWEEVLTKVTAIKEAKNPIGRLWFSVGQRVPKKPEGK